MNNPTLLKNLRNIPDFPIPGIQFKDVTTLFKDAECMQIMIDELYFQNRLVYLSFIAFMS